MLKATLDIEIDGNNRVSSLVISSTGDLFDAVYNEHLEKVLPLIFDDEESVEAAMSVWTGEIPDAIDPTRREGKLCEGYYIYKTGNVNSAALIIRYVGQE